MPYDSAKADSTQRLRSPCQPIVGSIDRIDTVGGDPVAESPFFDKSQTKTNPVFSPGELKNNNLRLAYLIMQKTPQTGCFTCVNANTRKSLCCNGLQ